MIAVIPARGGSKGVPQKNIKLLMGKPLIAYTIEAAIKSGIFERIIVSTDDAKIAQIAVKYGAEVPFIRPADISGDETSSDDVVLHALEYFREQGVTYQTVCKLQPTSPLRNENHMIEAYSIFEKEGHDYVVSVCECEHSPRWAGILGAEGNMDQFLDEESKRACRQQMEKYYRLNGAIYMGDSAKYIKNRSFFGTNCYAYIMGQEESVDIDSELDFLIAETMLRRKKELCPEGK